MVFHDIHHPRSWIYGFCQFVSNILLGVTGFHVHVDVNGDAVFNMVLLDFLKTTSRVGGKTIWPKTFPLHWFVLKLTYDHDKDVMKKRLFQSFLSEMKAVGEFKLVKSGNQTLELFPGMNISWSEDGQQTSPPVDTPPCGFNFELCSTASPGKRPFVSLHLFVCFCFCFFFRF